jgi:hypothetical protein
VYVKKKAGSHILTGDIFLLKRGDPKSAWSTREY